MHGVYPNVAGWQIAVRIAVYLLIVVVGSMLSAWLWVTLSPGIDIRDIRAMIRGSALPIHDYRKTQKAIERKVARSTLKIAMMGCGILGALLAVATMSGTLGLVRVGYLILAVSIVYGMYEEFYQYK